MSKVKLFFVVLLVSACQMFFIQAKIDAQTKAIIRCDDAGMCHSVNMAIKKLIATGVPFSTSVMFTCPWYQEAVEILKVNPQVSVGIHLTLNSEWKNYKWGPIMGKLVPSLVDSNGFFHASGEAFLSSKYKLDEVEKELRAQIERGIHSGLKIDYVDHHMFVASSTPELNSIVEKLAAEYNLGIASYYDEGDATVWDTMPENKLPELIKIISNLRNNKTSLIIMHIGMDDAELGALVDVNYPTDPYRVSKHRSAELEALSSKAFEMAVKKNNVELITFRELIAERGLKAMKRPVSAESN
jgi:hypothetical protein